MTASISFGVMADCQYIDKDDSDVLVMGTNHMYYNRPRKSLGKLQEAVDVFNELDIEFIVHLGDFTDKDLSNYDKLATITSGLKAPLWHVLGNHEYWGSEGNEAHILKTYGLESSYYSKVIRDFRFIVLDTNELGVMKHVPGTDEWNQGRVYIDSLKDNGAINAYDWNGGVGEQQFAWLRNELDDSRAKGEKVVLFAHHPVFPPGALNALNSDEVLDFISEYDNIVAFINGHNHCGAFGVRKSVPYITIPGMVQTETNAYGVVTINDDRIAIKGYGRVEDTVIEL